MIPDAKRKRDDECIEDRISNLPRHLIDNILDHMLICDAARTSILSKTWKNIWETRPHILLKDQFMNQLISSMKDSRAAQHRYLRVVNSILFAHVGPILTFSLCIPPYKHLRDTSCPLLWIKQLPEKGIRDLELHHSFENAAKDMPSYFFSCLDLTRLYLDNWKLLNPPHKFRGFRNLTRITLKFVVFTTDISFGTQVQNFQLLMCAGIEHLDIQLTDHGKNIKYLVVVRNKNIEKRYALDYSPFTNIQKSFDLRRLLGNMPSIETLKVDGTSLAFLDPGLTFHNHLSSTMENLNTLKLRMVTFDDVRVISNALCLLRSMPILEHLKITLHPKRKGGREVELTAEQYLESSDCADITLNQLQEPTGEGGATRAPIVIELKRDASLSSKSIVLQIDSKSQQVSASALRHSLQDRLSKISDKNQDEILLKLRTSTAPPLKLVDLPGVDKGNLGHSLTQYAEHSDAILLVIIPAFQAPDVSSAKALRIAKELDGEIL